MLRPLLFLIYINDLDGAVDVSGAVLEKFADNTKFAMVVESEEDKAKFQAVLDHLQASDAL